jgi:hypothetical protein
MIKGGGHWYALLFVFSFFFVFIYFIFLFNSDFSWLDSYGARNRTVYSPKKGPEHRKHDIIDGQTIGRATQKLKKTHIGPSDCRTIGPSDCRIIGWTPNCTIISSYTVCVSLICLILIDLSSTFKYRFFFF